MTMLTLPPLSVYVHLPWCVRKCPYCDFNSHEYQGTLPEQQYLQALLADLDNEANDARGRIVQSIFFGGGTPSLLSPAFYHRLLDVMAQSLTLAPDAEITLEANPGTVDQAYFDGYRQAGINRLSIGVQSFDALQLHNLGRIHNPDQALAAVGKARQAGFDNFNLDLMHGLPGQKPQQAIEDLQQAIALNPTHLSWYELTIEPNTHFWSHPPQQPDSDTLADTEAAGFTLLERHGYRRYEISAFAQVGKRSRHNLNYWRFGDYLGLGAGAHGKLTNPCENRISRYQKSRLPAHYMKSGGQARCKVRHLNEADRQLEFMLNALRLTEGVTPNILEQRTGLTADAVQRQLDDLRQKKLMRKNRIACTRKGLAHLNQVLLFFDRNDDQG